MGNFSTKTAFLATASAFLIIVAVALFPGMAYAESTPHALSKMVISQDYTSYVKGGDQSVAYELRGMTRGAGMPTGSEGGLFSFALDGDGEVEIDIPQEGFGPFEYEISCLTAIEDDSVVADHDSIRVVVYMLGFGDQATAVTIGYNDAGEKVSELAFDVVRDSQYVPVPQDERPSASDSTSKTGDVVLYVLAGAALTAVVTLVIAVIRRRRRDR